MTTDNKRLGYGGSAEIGPTGDTAQVLITSGNMEQANTPSYLEMADIPPTDSSRSRTLHADGTIIYSGTIAFDMTASALALMTTSKFLKRRYQFHIGIHDGENRWKMSDCYLMNLSLSGAPAGFITASLSFMAKSARSGPTATVANAYILTDTPMGYWWSGNANVKEWTLTMNQAVDPVYVNENISSPTPDSPRYLKVGLVDYGLDVTCYQDQSHSQIFIATTSFTLTGITTAKGYSFNGVTDLGMYSHSFVTAADAATGAGALVIQSP